MIGAIIVVVKLVGTLISFLEQLPGNKKDRVKELEDRIGKIESALAAPPTNS